MRINCFFPVTLILLYNRGFCSTVRDLQYLFGTKNTYNVSRKYAVDFRMTAKAGIYAFNEELRSKNCEAVHLNGLIRHGTRNPGQKDLGKFRDFLLRVQEFVKDNGRSSAPAAQVIYDAMDRWFEKEMFPDASSTDKELVQAGYEELFKLGQNLRDTFPDVLEEPSDLSFITSQTHRTIYSCEAFQDGLQLNKAQNRYTINNRLLRFYDYCPLYLETMADTERSMRELEEFKVGPEMEKLIQKMQHYFTVSKTRREKPIEIEHQDLKALYTIAACEVAVHNTSQLLTVFDPEDLLVMEYAADLRSYWKRSYGHEINYAQGCQLFSHIYSTIQDAVYQRNGYHKGIFRFGHAETLLPIMSLLELYKDESPLTAHTFNKQHKRLFKTGKISAFGANIIFVLYKCNDDNLSPTDVRNYKVALFHNEMPLNLPCCPDIYLCPFEKFQSYYSHIANEWNFKEICHIKDHDEL